MWVCYAARGLARCSFVDTPCTMLLARCSSSATHAHQRKRRAEPGTRGPSQTRTSESKFRSLQHNLELKQPYKQDIENARPDGLMQAQMYTPEVLKSENLTVNCFRMVAYGLHMPEILDRYGERAVELAAALRPDEFSKILTAFARAEHRHEGMLRAFTRYIPARLPQFLPMDLSQTCNAFAKLRQRDEEFFRRISSEVPHKLPLFEPYQLKNVANAYARLGIRDDLLFDDIADELMRRPEEFGAVDLYLLANAFSSFRICHPKLWLTLADWLLQTYLDLGAVEVAVLLNSMSTVGFHHDALLEALLRSLSQEPLISGLDASTTTLVLNALARLQWSGLIAVHGAIDALADHAVALLPDLDAAGVTRLLHACTKLQPLADHAGLVDATLKCAKEHVQEFNAQSLSLLVHCCAALKKRDAVLLTQVAKAVPTVIGEFTPQALAMTATGFAKLEIRSEILFYLLAAEACEKMPLFTGQGISMLLRAFGRLQVKNETLVQACRKQVRALTEELTLSEIDAIEAGFRALGALDGSTAAILRRQRRHLESTQAAVGAPRDPWASDEDRLLNRLAERPAKPVASPVWQKRESDDASPEKPLSRAPAQPDSKESLDLLDLWSKPTSAAGQDAPPGTPGSGPGDATAPSRLRDYLARPERIGTAGRRRPLDLDSPISNIGEPSSPSEDDFSIAGAQKRGRKSRR